MSAEQKARNMLARIGVERPQSFYAGDLVELANLIAERDELREQVKLLRDGLENMCKSVLNESGAWAKFFDKYNEAERVLAATEPKL